MTDLSRRDRIVLLAGALEDYLPGPWMGRSEWSAEGPSERRQCKRCQGEGRIRTRKGIEPCEACGSKGVVVVDAYTGRVVAKVRSPEEEFALPLAEVKETLAAERADYDARHRRRERVDHLLSEERQGEDWADWVLRRRRAQWRAGDFALLERHLGELAAQEMEWAVAFMIVYGPRASERVPGPTMRLRAELALDWLEAAMPEEIRVPSWLLAPRKRDDEILDLTRQGKTLVEIGERLGCSKSTVSATLKRLTAV